MSDPSQINLPIHTALTSDMMLGLKPAAPKSRSYRLSIPPINKSTFNPGDQMIFEFPAGRRGVWLDQSQTYIKFAVQCSSTAACAAVPNGISVDNSAYSFIQRLDIYNSSNLLETINEYGQLANLLIDTSLTQSDKAGLSSMIGTNYATYNIQSGTTVGSAITNIRIPGDRSGLMMASNITGAISSAIPYNFCLPLLSGVVGCASSKMLPIGKLTSPIRCEFYLAANDDAIYAGLLGVGAVWQLVNVEICACYVEIQNDEYNHVLTDHEMEYISTTTYRQSSTYIPSATAGEVTTLLPFRAASITALYARFLPYATVAQGTDTGSCYRKGASLNPNFGSIYFRIGSSIYPNKPIYLKSPICGSGSEAYAELLKSFHALSSSIGNTAITFLQYNVAPTATAGTSWSVPYPPGNQIIVPGTSNNAFALGLECQSFSNRNDTILSGISTLNFQIYFTGNVATGETCGLNFTAHFFASMDMILCIDQNGVMSAKF